MDFPFTTDGCSLFPDGDWGDCCVTHDKAYWRGGTFIEKVKADWAMLRCVFAKKHPFIAVLMFIGVSIFGLPYFPTWFRWGYGWRYSKAFTFSQLKMLLEQPHMGGPEDYISTGENE